MSDALIAILVFAAVVVAAAACLIASVRRSHRRRQADSQALYQVMLGLEIAARDLPERSSGAQTHTAGMTLILQDRAAANLSSRVRELIPQLDTEQDPGSADSYLTLVQEHFEILERNATLVAGIEQLVLIGANSTITDSLAMPDALLQLAGAPDRIHDAVAELSDYIQGPEIGGDLLHAAHEMFSHAVQNLPDLGVGALTAAVQHSPADLLLVAPKWAANEVLQGFQDFTQQASESADVADAIAQIGHAGVAADTVLNIDGAIGYFPFITAAIAGVRETRLLQEGKTTIDTSVRNITLDVGGTGGGAFVGAKIGAVAGTVVAPGVGSVIGTIAGAALGTVGGRAMTNHIKTRTYRAAAADFDSLREAQPARMRDLAAELTAAAAEHTETARAAFQASVPAAPQTGITRHDELRSMVQSLQADTVTYLRGIEQEIDRAQQLAAAGRIPTLNLEKAAAALTDTRRSVAVAAELHDTPPLLQLCTLAQAGPPVAAGSALGEQYQACARRTADRLRVLSAAHADDLRVWITEASAELERTTRNLTAALGPNMRTFRDRQSATLDELEAAAGRVKDQAGRLGR